MLVPAQLLEEKGNVFRRCGEKKSVLCLNYEIAARDDGFAVSLRGANEDFRLVFAAEIFEFEPHEVGIAAHSKFHELNLTV